VNQFLLYLIILIAHGDIPLNIFLIKKTWVIIDWSDLEWVFFCDSGKLFEILKIFFQYLTQIKNW